MLVDARLVDAQRHLDAVLELARPRQGELHRARPGVGRSSSERRRARGCARRWSPRASLRRCVTCADTGASVLLCTIAAASKRSPRSANRGMIGSSKSGLVTTKLDSAVPPPPTSSTATAVMRNSVRLSGSFTFAFTRPSPSVTRSGSHAAVSTKFLSRIERLLALAVAAAGGVRLLATAQHRRAAVGEEEVEAAARTKRRDGILRVIRGHAEHALVDHAERDVGVLHGHAALLHLDGDLGVVAHLVGLLRARDVHLELRVVGAHRHAHDADAIVGLALADREERHDGVQPGRVRRASPARRRCRSGPRCAASRDARCRLARR